jgi:hypothetical protein
MAALAACSGYEKNAIQSITGTLPGSYVRFANFSVSAPGVNFYANNTKLTAIGSSSCSPPPTTPNPACTSTGLESTTGTASGAFATASTGLYSTLAPGSYALNARIAAATDKDLQISSVTTNIEVGKYYTFYNSGTYDPATKKTEAFVVEDPIPAAFDYTQAYVRFVNAVSTSAPSVLFVKNQVAGSPDVAVGGTIAYKGAGAFTPLPGGVYDLNTRLPGTTANVISRTGVTFAAGRMYTITARATSATAAALDNTQNR